jgi:hypothetical protein
MFFRRKKLFYRKGDRVKIADPGEIKRTLDKDNKLDGLLFMNQMWQYCGEEAIIIKIVKNFEHNKLTGPGFTILKAKVSIYMLTGIFCDGNSELLGKKCDLNCNLMWHAAWLQQI